MKLNGIIIIQMLRYFFLLLTFCCCCIFLSLSFLRLRREPCVSRARLSHSPRKKNTNTYFMNVLDDKLKINYNKCDS